MKKIRLIWEFRGPDAHQTALHHEIHLKEFLQRENRPIEVGVEKLSELFSIAFLVTTKDQMIPLRDALKPHRGEYID